MENETYEIITNGQTIETTRVYDLNFIRDNVIPMSDLSTDYPNAAAFVMDLRAYFAPDGDVQDWDQRYELCISDEDLEEFYNETVGGGE